MPRAIWNGAISFGLVSIPVQLSTAVRQQRPRFHLLHGKDESAVHYQRVCEREARPVRWEEIVKGFEYEKGRYAILTKEDFQKAALEKSETIDILAFVGAGTIDPRYFETSYYLTPAKAGARAYALLREAIRDTEQIGVAQIILRQEQHLAALWVKDEAFVLTMLRFAEELTEPGAIEAPPRKSLRQEELQMAVKLVGGLTADWKPERYRDRYTENLMAIIKAKSKGRAPHLAAIGPRAPGGDVADLMERLRASLAGPRTSRAEPTGSPRGHRRTSRPAPARARGAHRKAPRKRAA